MQKKGTAITKQLILTADDGVRERRGRGRHVPLKQATTESSCILSLSQRACYGCSFFDFLSSIVACTYPNMFNRRMDQDSSQKEEDNDVRNG